MVWSGGWYSGSYLEVRSLDSLRNQDMAERMSVAYARARLKMSRNKLKMLGRFKSWEVGEMSGRYWAGRWLGLAPHRIMHVAAGNLSGFQWSSYSVAHWCQQSNGHVELNLPGELIECC